MRSIAAQLADARAALVPVAGDAAAVEARVLAAHAWGVTPELLVRDAAQTRDAAPLMQLVARRLKHEPVSHITGEKPFWKDTFTVTADVLTPRADSETLIETLLRLRPQVNAPMRMLDLGTGSGCLLLSALREYPQAEGVGVDQSEAALAVASQNAARLGLASRAMLQRSDWFSGVAGQFDIILSNPPYIPAGDAPTLAADVRDYEPHAALFGGEDGLDCYRTILAEAASFMAPGGLLLFEVGAGQAGDVAALGTGQGFTLAAITPDLAGIARVVVFEHTHHL